MSKAPPLEEMHVLGLSGGKDSAALALFMNKNFPELEMQYFFTDTGKELPEVYDYLVKLEGKLAPRKINRLNSERDFDHFLQKYNYFLPSPQTRWCTRALKLKPFENWINPFLERGVKVYSYVAIRSDENYREGYDSKHQNLIVKLPFKDAGVDKKGVMQILDVNQIGLPTYYNWRSRSGCTFCFYQQKIEWVRLKENHPDAYEDAKKYEKTALSHGSPFSWCDGETLEDLEKPERIAKIKADHEKRLERARAKLQTNPLRPDGDLVDIDDIYGQQKVCLSCHK